MGKLRKAKGGTKPMVAKKAPKRSAKGSKSKTKALLGLGRSVANRYLPVDEALATSKAFRPGSTGMRRHRRINPMNAKAARKAATRVRSSIRMLERLKKSLPHVTAKGKVTNPKRKR